MRNFATSIMAGVAYFALVFALGFALGTGRVLLLAPLLGNTWATALELPVMLLVSWIICCWCVQAFAVCAAVQPRLAMGAMAFVLLIAAETVLGVMALGRTLSEQFQNYRQTGPAMGLIAQLAFASFPVFELLRERPHRKPAPQTD